MTSSFTTVNASNLAEQTLTLMRSEGYCSVRLRLFERAFTAMIVFYNNIHEGNYNQEIGELFLYNIKKTQPLISGKMTTACIRNLVQKYIVRAKSKNPKLFSQTNYSPHSFRHSKAVHMAEAGTPLIYIRNFLGHASVSSTEVYAQVSQAAVMKAISERKNSEGIFCSTTTKIRF
jgi:site-specific recombinase XerD